jgi:16S rRNA (uracil1498-N3)-methyltransferase
MSDRFFSAAPITGDDAVLSGPEAHHLAHVMRAQVGEIVTLFDGSGQEFSARVQTIGKRDIELEVVERRDVNRESPVRLTLAVALPKGERQRWLVEKAVELGVAELVPLETERGVAQPSDAALERLRRSVIEASKQCGRNRLMEIGSAQSWRVFHAAQPGDGLRFLAYPGGTALRTVRPHRAADLSCATVQAAIGPEGGFTDEEIGEATKAGWTTVDLGPRILRVETAAIALAAWAICR